MSFDAVSIGKILAAAGGALTAAGLFFSSPHKELIVAAGVFITAVSAYLAHGQIKKINGNN